MGKFKYSDLVISDIEQHIDLIEQQIELADKSYEQLKDESKEDIDEIKPVGVEGELPLGFLKGREHDDYNKKLFSHLLNTDFLLPRVVYHPLVISIWALYESAIRRITLNVRGKQRFEARSGGGDFIRKAIKYFDDNFDIQFQYSSDQWWEFRLLYWLRNKIAHSDGMLNKMDIYGEIYAAIGEEKIEGISTSAVGTHFVITSEYVWSAYALVEGHLRYLMEEVKEKGEVEEKPKV